MKKNEIRALADEAYTILDDFECEAAVERALSVLVNAPDDPESYLLIAEVSEENERFDQAVMWINRGLAHFHDHAGLLLKKASLLINGFEDIDEAFVILSQLKMRFEGKSLDDLKKDYGTLVLLEVHLLLADCYRLNTNFNAALACAKRAYEIAPSDENATLSLATAHFELGNYDTALEMLEPVHERNDAPDFLWQKALILCAQGRFDEADSYFLEAYKADKSRYHRPIRLDEQGFVNAFEQALMALPREIRSFLQSTSVTLSDVIPLDVIKSSQGTMSPLACIGTEQGCDDETRAPIIFLYQKNIENLASKRVEIKDLIASALLHDLAKLAVNS